MTVASAIGLAASFSLSGCGAESLAGASTAGSAARDAAGLTSTSAARTTVEAPSTVPLQASLPRPAGQKPYPGHLMTFTFPDGHFSFSYPGSWTVKTAAPPNGLPGVEAVIADGSGTELITFAEGVTAGCTGGPVSRRVLDRARVPGFNAAGNAEAVFGFVVESSAAGDTYVMGLADSRSLEQGDDVSSWCSFVASDDAGLFNRVIFNDPAFPTTGAARAWMATEQYRQIKALLVSIESH
jgi:hypothetical protein